MSTIIISAIGKEVDYQKVMKELDKFAVADYFFMVNEKPKRKIKAKFFVFDKNTKENKALNTVFKETTEETLVIKSGFDLNGIAQVKDLLKKLSDGADIVMFTPPEVKKHSWPDRIAERNTNFLYGFELYRGDTEVIALSAAASTVLRNISRPSLLLEVNKWTGMKIEYCINNETRPKRHKTPKTLLIYSVLSALVGAGAITTSVLLTMHISLVILLFGLGILSILMMWLFITKQFIYARIGDPRK